MLQDFNPRAPRGARRGTDRRVQRGNLISIHAPREGRDSRSPPLEKPTCYFNPRAPRGARPVSVWLLPYQI